MRFLTRNLRTVAVAAGAVLVIALGGFVLALPNDEPTRETATTTTEAPTRYEERGFDSRAELNQAKDDYAFAVAGLWKQNVDFKVWTEAAWNAYLAELAARAASRPSGGGTSYGGSCDGEWVIPSYIVQRESGCSYDAYNPTGCGGQGCYGAYQVHGMHYGPGGACAGLSQSPADQDECARRLSNGGSNLDPWASTR